MLRAFDERYRTERRKAGKKGRHFAAYPEAFAKFKRLINIGAPSASRAGDRNMRPPQAPSGRRDAANLMA